MQGHNIANCKHLSIVDSKWVIVYTKQRKLVDSCKYGIPLTGYSHLFRSSQSNEQVWAFHYNYMAKLQHINFNIFKIINTNLSTNKRWLSNKLNFGDRKNNKSDKKREYEPGYMFYHPHSQTFMPIFIRLNTKKRIKTL